MKKVLASSLALSSIFFAASSYQASAEGNDATSLIFMSFYDLENDKFVKGEYNPWIFFVEGYDSGVTRVRLMRNSEFQKILKNYPEDVKFVTGGEVTFKESLDSEKFDDIFVIKNVEEFLTSEEIKNLKGKIDRLDEKNEATFENVVKMVPRLGCFSENIDEVKKVAMEKKAQEEEAAKKMEQKAAFKKMQEGTLFATSLTTVKKYYTDNSSKVLVDVDKYINTHMSKGASSTKTSSNANTDVFSNTKLSSFSNFK